MEEILKNLDISPNHAGTSTGLNWINENSNDSTVSFSPVNGGKIGVVNNTSSNEYNKVILSATEAFKVWRMMPAPKRGEVVRQFGDELRKNKKTEGMWFELELGIGF